MAAQVEYRPIPGFPGYRIGTDGTVWSCIKGTGAWKCRRVYLSDEWKQLKPWLTAGYPMVSFWSGGHRFHRHIHRLMLEIFVGPCPEGMECCHNDGNRLNLSLSNLRWDTRKANSEDSRRHGSLAVGSKAGQAKLTEEDVVEIIKELQAGKPGAQIARERGVRKTTIHWIKKGGTWKHVNKLFQQPKE